jgi:hypothetical protein
MVYVRRMPLTLLVNIGFISRPQLYKLKSLNRITFHYLLSSVFIDMEELYSAMTTESEGDADIKELTKVNN